MQHDYPIFCAGKFIRTASVLPVSNPFTGEVFATTYLAGEKEIEVAINQSNQAKQKMVGLSSYQRFELLNAISMEIKKKRLYLAELLCLESAKPMRYALAEIDRSAQTFLVAAEETKRLPKEYISLDWTPHGLGKNGIIHYFPVGIVAGIAPFNFPMNLAVHKIAPAIASGCPIILKPASKTPLSTLELAKIISDVGLPDGSVSVLPMDRAVGNQLVYDKRINMLSFTGSPEVGWKMKSNSGNKKVTLELGGNAGVIISDKNTTENLIQKCIYGAFAYSGQICIHAQRFIVHESCYASFILEMKNAALQLKNENPLHESALFSVMIDEENAIRAENWIREALEEGASLICGGKRVRNYLEPTLLTNCTENMKVYAEEVFAPVITIESYSGSISAAVEQLNKSKYGLQCGIFTDSIEELNYCFKHAEVGGVIHNDVPTIRFDHMPYGGIKESGLGREGVKYAIQDMLEPRILVS